MKMLFKTQNCRLEGISAIYLKQHQPQLTCDLFKASTESFQEQTLCSLFSGATGPSCAKAYVFVLPYVRELYIKYLVTISINVLYTRNNQFHLHPKPVLFTIQ